MIAKRPEQPDPRAPSGGISVRRFAGSARFAEQLERPLQVAHLTDLHVGLVTPMRAQLEAVALTNAERPDLVVITGDFVCHSHAWLEDLTAVIRAFEAPVLAVLGNHDHWAGAPGVRRALLRGGAELLGNRNTTLRLRGQLLQVVGLDDAYTGHADRALALRGMNPRLPTLGLSHIAEEADGLWAAGVPLVLSGHTHAGQLTVARLNELVLGRLVGHRYIHGLYGTRGHGQATPPEGLGAVYVGAGIGAAVLPVRLGERAQRELTIFTLGGQPDPAAEHHGEQAAHRPRPEIDEAKARAEAHARFQQRRLRRFRAPRGH